MNTPNTFTEQLNNTDYLETNYDIILATIEDEELDASQLSLDEINKFIENLDNQ